MDDYISREEAKRFFNLNFGGVSHAIIASRLLDEIPAADVSQVRHGRWVNEDFPDEQVDATDPAICSECKEPAHKAEHGYAILSKYCPNCGCLMDGGSDNG